MKKKTQKFGLLLGAGLIKIHNKVYNDIILFKVIEL